MKDTVVYYAYDAEDVCIYVGSTCNVGHRMYLHRTTSPWWEHHTRIEIDGPYTRDAARQREREEIFRLSPVFNTTGVDKYREEDLAKYRAPDPAMQDAMRAALDSLKAPA